MAAADRRNSSVIWKIIIGGSSGVGKTTLLYRYLYDEFVSGTETIDGAQFNTKWIVKDGVDITLGLWDLGGQDHFRIVLRNYIKGANAALVLFDMGRVLTFVEADGWVSFFREYDDDIPIFLVGTKYDTITGQEAAVIRSTGNKKVKKSGLVGYMPTSAKFGYNVKEVMDCVVDCLLRVRAMDKPTGTRSK
jgi:Ras-related protein Rab-5C